MRISRQLVPPGGWAYIQGDYKLQAQTFEALVDLVLNHRQSNGIEIGNVTEEVEEQIAESNPSIIINGYKSKKANGS